jgi:hypothetical protein
MVGHTYTDQAEGGVLLLEPLYQVNQWPVILARPQ